MGGWRRCLAQYQGTHKLMNSRLRLRSPPFEPELRAWKRWSYQTVRG